MAKMTLDGLVTQLRSVYGSDLHAVVLYGSAAAGEHFRDRSDLNVLVIVESVGLERMRALSAVARSWASAGNPAPLTLTREEWSASADIFPMEYADILERNRVLHGELPTEGLIVHREHLRLQVELEAMGKLLRLRQEAIISGGGEKDLLQLLEASLSTMMVIFRGALRLHGIRPPTDYVELSRETGRVAGFDPDPFISVTRHVRGEAKLPAGSAGDCLARYLTGLRQLVAFLDRYDPGEEAGGATLFHPKPQG
jgi:hypothetical protein